MVTRDMVVANPSGLHMRVAARIVELVRRHGARVRLFGSDNRQAAGDSVLDLMSLGVSEGKQVRVEVEGPRAQQVADGLREIFSDGGGI